MNKLLFAGIILAHFSSFAQTELHKKWIMLDQSCGYKQPTTDAVQLDLSDKEVMSISRRNPALSFSGEYVLENDSIISSDFSYKILKLTRDTLLLDLGIEMRFPTLFVSEQKAIDYQKQNFFLEENDTVFMASRHHYPILDNSFYYADITRRINRDIQKACSVSISFIVNKEGEVTNLKTKSDCNKKEEKFRKYVERLIDGKWQPMTFYGKPVNSYVKMYFKTKRVSF